MTKSADAFRTISEVSEAVDVPAHVLRFWEGKFPQIKPVKRSGGRRYYRPTDVQLLAGIRQLLHIDGLTIRGVQKILREQGVAHVMSLANLDVAGEDQDVAIATGADVVPVEAAPAEAAVVEEAAPALPAFAIPSWLMPQPPTAPEPADPDPETVLLLGTPVLVPVKPPAPLPIPVLAQPVAPAAYQPSWQQTSIFDQIESAPDVSPDQVPDNTAPPAADRTDDWSSLDTDPEEDVRKDDGLPVLWPDFAPDTDPDIELAALPVVEPDPASAAHLAGSIAHLDIAGLGPLDKIRLLAVFDRLTALRGRLLSISARQTA